MYINLNFKHSLFWYQGKIDDDLDLDLDFQAIIGHDKGGIAFFWSWSYWSTFVLTWYVWLELVRIDFAPIVVIVNGTCSIHTGDHTFAFNLLGTSSYLGKQANSCIKQLVISEMFVGACGIRQFCFELLSSQASCGWLRKSVTSCLLSCSIYVEHVSAMWLFETFASLFILWELSSYPHSLLY